MEILLFRIKPSQLTLDQNRLISNGHNARPILVPILRNWLNEFKGEKDSLFWDFKEEENSLYLYQNSSHTHKYKFHATENPETIGEHHIKYFYAEIIKGKYLQQKDYLQMLEFYAVGISEMKKYRERYEAYLEKLRRD